ncbi:hypothetical protein ONZ45_g19366 [Pleurotus djamor]|nr:hypothetical protein ONZ45_g19366 [Pleurotus djamor]
MDSRSRREKKAKLEAMAQLKRVREGGAREFKETDHKLYDEVTEEQYRSVVRGRLQQDDFVVDDGVGGYVDNGMDDEILDERLDDESDGDERPVAPKRKGVYLSASVTSLL